MSLRLTVIVITTVTAAPAWAGEGVGRNPATPPFVVAPRPTQTTAYVPGIAPALAAQIRQGGPDRAQRFVAKGLDPDVIRAAGGIVTAQIGPIVSGVLTGRQLIDLAPTAIRLDAPRRYRPALDISRVAIGAEPIDFGEGYSATYRGDGALIGVYDTGIDLRHPDLREVDGPTRVEALWDQSRVGTPPPGRRGGDYCDRDRLTERRCPHRDILGHGTLISSIAASNGPQYRGVAPNAGLVVATSTSFDMFLESLSWFASVAATLEKPLVVNLSLAGQEGPHDGTSLEAQAIDAYDHLVVTAAGNEGALGVHAVARLEKGDRRIVLLRFPLRAERATREATVDIWGDVGPEVSAQVEVRAGDGALMTNTPTIAPGDAGRTDRLGTSDRTFGFADLDTDDPLSVENRQGHIRIALRLENWEDAPDGPGYIAIRIAGEGRIDLWVDSPVSEPAPIRFDRDRILDDDTQILGDTDHTISDLATAISGVSVSAYVTRTEFTNSDGENRMVTGTVGEIASFSSWGPTLRESTTGKKPDLAAPGHLVVGARSQDLILDDGSAVGELYRAAAGTSMAAPHVAGVAALILGAKPEVSKTDLKSYLLGGATTDDQADPTLDPRWGTGRLNAAGALELAGIEHDSGCGCRTTHPATDTARASALLLLALLAVVRRKK